MTPEFVGRWLSREAAREFLRFAAVGAAATIVHYVLMIALVEALGVSPVLATVCGFLVGALGSYSLHRRYTFAARPAFGKGLAKYLLVVAIGAVINAGIVAAFVAAGIHYMIGQVVATGLVLIWNFGAARAFVFR